jgi:hypothetical protein
LPRSLTHFRRPLALCFAAVLTLVTGCGAPVVQPCGIPTDVDAVADALAGTWTMLGADGETRGTVTFRGDAVQALSDETTYYGTWELAPADPFAHALTVTFTGADLDGGRQVWDEPLIVRIVLSWASDTTLLALEDNGVWTRWQRLTSPVP